MTRKSTLATKPSDALALQSMLMLSQEQLCVHQVFGFSLSHLLCAWRLLEFVC